MASLQVDATPLEDAITETEASSKEAQTVAPPENVKTVDVEDEDDDDLEDLTAPPYEEKVVNSDDEEEDKDAEYSSFMDREEAPPSFNYGGGPAAFDDFNEDDDPEDVDDA